MRTFCMIGWPLPPLVRPRSPLELLLLPLLLLLLPVPVPEFCNAPKPEVPPVEDVPREEKLLPDAELEDELFAFSDRRAAALELELRPEPGASWLSELSSEEDEPPMNMSTRIFAIWRASPYFTR